MVRGQAGTPAVPEEDDQSAKSVTKGQD